MGRGATILIAGALLFSGFVTVGCGENDSPSEAELREARLQGAQAARLRELERQVRQQERKQGGGSSTSQALGTPTPPASGSRTPCGGDVTAGPNTSCPFAQSVRSAYPGSDSSFEVYSSVTGQTYTMRCTTGSPHVCTGGNNASVYFP